MSGTFTSTISLFHFYREHVGGCGRIAVELAAGRDAGFGHLTGGLGLGVNRMHRAQREAAARTNAPEFLELEHFAVAVQAIDAGGVGNDHAELARFVRVAVLFLGLKEEVVLQIGVQLGEGVEHLVLAAQVEQLAGHGAYGLSQNGEVRHRAGHADEARAAVGLDLEYLGVVLEPVGQAGVPERDQGVRRDRDVPCFSYHHNSCHFFGRSGFAAAAERFAFKAWYGGNPPI